MIPADTLAAWKGVLAGLALDYDVQDADGRVLFRTALERQTRHVSSVLVVQLARHFGGYLQIEGVSTRYATRVLADAYIAQWLSE